MKFLIAGLGSIGRRHFRNLIALGEKDIVLLRSHHATLSDDELISYPVETDLDEALRKYKPDAVIISNPTSLHLDVAIPAAETGCSILMEKPISNSLGRIDELALCASTRRRKIPRWLSIPLPSDSAKSRAIVKGKCYRQTAFIPCSMGRISSQLASVGGFQTRLRGSILIWEAV